MNIIRRLLLRSVILRNGKMRKKLIVIPVLLVTAMLAAGCRNEGGKLNDTTTDNETKPVINEQLNLDFSEYENIPLSELYSDVVGGGEIGITEAEGKVTLYNGTQKLELTQTLDGYVMTTYVKAGADWKPMFDSGLPLVQGKHFSVYPDFYEVKENTKDRISVKFFGSGPNDEYVFDIEVTLDANTQLIHIVQTNHLTKDMKINGEELRLMLWKESGGECVYSYMNTPGYLNTDDVVNNCFPYAYLWNDGIESAVYFDMETMTWFSFNSGVDRFNSCRVYTAEENGKIGIGFDRYKKSSAFCRISSWDMVFDFWLYGGERTEKPSRLEALKTSVDAFAVCVNDIPVAPENHVDPGQTSYTYICGKMTEQLSVQGYTYSYKDSGKVNAGNIPGKTTDKMLMRPFISITSNDAVKESEMTEEWANTNNVTVAAIAYNRQHPNETYNEYLPLMLLGFKDYYSPQSKLQTSFKNLAITSDIIDFIFGTFFTVPYTLKAMQLCDPELFDGGSAAVPILSMTGLMEIAHVNDYYMPHMYSLYDYTNRPDRFDFDDGIPYITPFGLGTYAYNMCQAYDYTGDETYLNEAKIAVEKMFSGEISYTLNGKTVNDVCDYGVNDTPESAYGVAACQYLYSITGNEVYLDYSKNFRDLTMRMFHWFESDLANDKEDRSIALAGLFAVGSYAVTPTNWENIHTYLGLLPELANEDIAPSKLMLSAYNLNRVNNLYYVAAMWDPATMPYASAVQSTNVNYLCSEAYYVPEYGVNKNGMQGINIYMSLSPYYGWVMYEAYMQANDPDIMVLNTDITNNAFNMVNGVERNFIISNPTSEMKTFTLRQFALEDKVYVVTVTDCAGNKSEYNVAGEALMNSGIQVVLPGERFFRVKVTMNSEDKAHYDTIYSVQKLMTKCSVGIVKLADAGLKNSEQKELRQAYSSLTETYDGGDYALALSEAQSLYERIKSLQ